MARATVTINLTETDAFRDLAERCQRLRRLYRATEAMREGYSDAADTEFAEAEYHMCLDDCERSGDLENSEERVLSRLDEMDRNDPDALDPSLLVRRS